MAGNQGVVTPEAVRLELPEAGVGSRAAALVVDWTILAIIGFVVGVVGGRFLDEIPRLPEWVVVTLIIVVSFLLVFGYSITFETVWRGRTPGKAALGLRVLTAEGSTITFRHAAIRAALGLVDFTLTFGFAAVLSAFFSRRHQRLGDFVAGTVVVRERTGAGEAVSHQFVVPDSAASIADAIDTSGLTNTDYAVIRSYLSRADTLPAARRHEIGQQILVGVTPRLGTLPATDLPPDVVLQTVAARYQERTRQRRDALA